MKFVAYLNVISPHQLPLARELVKALGEKEFRYVYLERSHRERVKLGWMEGAQPFWCLPYRGNEQLVEDADVVYSGCRDVELFERRAARSNKTFYYSERWFKPIEIGVGRRWRCCLPGWIRMLVPSYFRMARRFVKWMNKDPGAFYLAVGPWAARDMRLLGVRSNKIVQWGYFVEPSMLKNLPRRENVGALRLLWVGRMLRLKRVDDVIRAVARCVASGRRVTFDVYGGGTEEVNLKRLASKLGLEGFVSFYPAVSIGEVRRLMHDHDVYVFSSNAQDGWGAVVSEALEEGMKVVGTFEAGATAAILPSSNLYHAGDWKRLAEILQGNVEKTDIGAWTSRAAASRILELGGFR